MVICSLHIKGAIGFKITPHGLDIKKEFGIKNSNLIGVKRKSAIARLKCLEICDRLLLKPTDLLLQRFLTSGQIPEFLAELAQSCSHLGLPQKLSPWNRASLAPVPATLCRHAP